MKADVYEKWMFRILVALALTANVSTGGTVTMIVIGLLLMLVQAVWTRSLPAVDKGMAVAVLVYLGAWAACCLGSREILFSLKALVGASYRFLPLFFALLYVRRKEQVRFIVLALAASIFINDCAAVWQLLTHPWGFHPHGRVHSATFLGSHMLMAVPAMFFFSQKMYFRPIERKLLLFMTMFSLAILVLTQTRGAWLAFAGVVAVYLLLEQRCRRQILAGILVGVVCVGIGLLASPTYSQRFSTIADPKASVNVERVYMWNAAVEIWRDHPLLGVGLDEYGWYYNTTYIPAEAKEVPVVEGDPDTGHGHPHNNILKHLSEGGIVGILAFFFLHGYILWRLLQRYRIEHSRTAFSCALMGILIFAGTHFEGLTDTNINQLSILTEYCLLMGLSLAAGMIEEREKV
ncbi:O-antigen ligase family protein [Selenomonas sputigena]|uniref:O-antigen ligase family protein n=1 Tax=Selenomonas sputigena TaxID=69823 RepID=A0ABV3X4R6_9FIRM